MKKKRHKLIITITHDKPVSRQAAVKMFRDNYCLPGFPTDYYVTAPEGENAEQGFIVAARSAGGR